MIIENTQNHKRIKCTEAFSLFQKMRGLMFRKKTIPILFDFFNDGLYAIHSFFVPEPFYAIYMSSSGKVVDKFRVVPSEAYRKNSVPARYLLEIDESNAVYFNKGDMVKFYVRMEDVN